MTPSPRALLLAAVVVPLAAVAAALVSQYVFDMQPCPWCVLQRVVFVAIALAALPGLLMNRISVRRASAAGVLVLALCGAAAAPHSERISTAAALARRRCA